MNIYPNDLAVNPSKFKGVVSSDTMYGRVGGNVGDTIMREGDDRRRVEGKLRHWLEHII